MSTFTVGVIVWIVAGVLAAFVLLGRQGYRDRRWYVLGAVFGPLFIPIAAERANRSVAVVEGAEPAARSGPSIVVGVDGSAGADRTVRLAATLFDTAGARRPRGVVASRTAAGPGPEGRTTSVAGPSTLGVDRSSERRARRWRTCH